MDDPIWSLFTTERVKTMNKYLKATIYAKQQPEPLLGDELYPDGCVSIEVRLASCLTYKELLEMIAELVAVSAKMERPK